MANKNEIWVVRSQDASSHISCPKTTQKKPNYKIALEGAQNYELHLNTASTMIPQPHAFPPRRASAPRIQRFD